MTGKYVLSSALLSQEPVHFESFSLLLLHFHISAAHLSTTHHPWQGLGIGGAPRKQGHSPMLSSAVWLCTAPDCSSQTTTLSHSSGAVQFYFIWSWTAFKANLFIDEVRFLAGVCQCRLEGIATLVMVFSFWGYSAKSMKDFAWHEWGVTPKPWLFSM